MIEISKENIGSLSDEQLFKVMKRNGLNVGPITSTTRHLYEKKLRNHLDNNMSMNVTTLTAACDLPNDSMNTSNLNDKSMHKGSLRSTNKSSTKAETSQNKLENSSNQKNMLSPNVNSSRNDTIINRRSSNKIKNVDEKMTSRTFARVSIAGNEEMPRTTFTTVRREEPAHIDRQYTSATRQELTNSSKRSSFNYDENRSTLNNSSTPSKLSTRELVTSSSVTTQLVAPSLTRATAASSYSGQITSGITSSSPVASSHYTEPIRSSINTVPNTMSNSLR